jgi:hypothetical protein
MVERSHLLDSFRLTFAVAPVLTPAIVRELIEPILMNKPLF